MKQTIKALLVLALFSMAGTVTASPLTLADNYIGKGYNKDIKGNETYFGIDSLKLNHSGSTVKIDIDTNYTGSVLDAYEAYNTEMGDFFISTNGYNPATPSTMDNFFNGEKWEYAFVFDDHDIFGTGKNNGFFSLFKLSDDYKKDGAYSKQILLSNEVHTENGIRKNQEVRVDTAYNKDGIVGDWNVDTSGLHLTITNDFFENNFSFDAVRWQMTCANDVIEGAPVPEPATMLLFGVGLIGLARVFRKINSCKIKT